MVRHYIRKTARQSWAEDSMRQAIEAVRTREMGYQKASAQFAVPKSTLERRVKDINKRALGTLKILGSKQPVFNNAMETELSNYIQRMEERLFGLTTDDIKGLAFQLASRNGIPNPFNKEDERAGRDWLCGFLKRNAELALRTPEATSAARARGFNKTSVVKFFELLSGLIEKNHYSPHNIYNCDETGITTVQSKSPKILAKKGKKRVGALTSAERGTLVTVEIAANAAGNFIPPFLIFPRVRMKLELMEGTPPGSIYACHSSGWMQTEIFTIWFRHFLAYAKPTEENPVLLILDGHSTHTKNIEVIDLARDNHVEILCLPPHTTHRLQPLDVSFMKPLSTYFDQEVNKWLKNNPGRVVTQFQLGGLFGKAYIRSANMETAVNGFKATGICPYNSEVFPDHEFAPSDVTDIPLDQNIEGEVAVADVTGNGEQARAGGDRVSLNGEDSVEKIPHADVAVALAETSNTVHEAISGTRDKVMEHHAPLMLDVGANVEIGTDENQPAPIADPDTVTNIILSQDINPFPKQTVKKVRSGVRGKTVVITGSPYKQELLSAKVKARVKPNTASSRKRAVGGTNQDKHKRKRNQTAEPKATTSTNDPDDENDTECLYCGELFSDTPDDGSIRCNSCHRWAHNACAGTDESTFSFDCDYC